MGLHHGPQPAHPQLVSPVAHGDAYRPQTAGQRQKKIRVRHHGVDYPAVHIIKMAVRTLAGVLDGKKVSGAEPV
ncbi:hypothetical protein SDC9_169814 [bioreactor metagenome]|uniref:Uncharacterized protein n=1 Tax=bioreactor metagenome TaxID=1076179 RepID=A0A645G6C4_9ZZZZ